MIIKIRNFGAIKSCDIDLDKDLIAIFGENNIGKSYAISAVYLLLKNIFKELPFFIYFDQVNVEIIDRFFHDSVTGIINDVVQKKEKITNITKNMENIVRSYLEKTLIASIIQPFSVTFGEIDTIKNKFINEKTYIELDTNELIFSISFDENEIKISNLIIKKKIIVKLSKVNKKIHGEKEIQIYFCEKNQDSFKINLGSLIRHYVSHFQRDYFVESYYLPASRSGLYQGLSAFGQIFAQLAKSRNLLKQTVEIPSISEPVSDYFIALSGIEIKSKIKEDDPILEITNKIEKNILSGKISFDEKAKKILYHPDNTDLTLDVSLTSSMVSEISSIVSFLRYIVAPTFQTRNPRLTFVLTQKKKVLLFIEEPEAHLHPKIQMELMEIFVELVNAGVKIVFTSHSDYMFNKMNNLILEKKLAVEKASVIVFHKTEEGGVAKAVSIDELGADDENFIEAAETLYNEKIDLINKLNNESN
jgi:predicted ATPase